MPLHRPIPAISQASIDEIVAAPDQMALTAILWHHQATSLEGG